MITNENEFLGLMIKCKNDDDTCSICTIIAQSRMTDIQCIPFLNSLSEQKIISKIDLETYQINPIAYSVYQSTAKKAGKLVYNFSKFTLQRLLDILIGVATGVAATVIAQHFFGQ